MNRTLEVTIDQSTWNTTSAALPPTFHIGTSSWNVNVPLVLLAIGFLTTPSHGSGASLSEFWAWVRYIHAISDDMDLRITRPFFELDAHQKMILSDDFGMGFPICWLIERLQLDQIVDGRYFIDRLAASAGATARRPAKRGPGKSPDFVAQDVSGIWHVIECKGTQTSISYRNRQLNNPNPHPSGAVVQKHTIFFPPSYTGQRLGCGLYIGVEGNSRNSDLLIIDPPAEKSFEVDENHIAFAENVLKSSAGSRALRLAGFGATSSFLSAPWGASPSSRPTKGLAEQRRRETVRQKANLARSELDSREQYEAFGEGDNVYRGRLVEFRLPKPVGIRGSPIQRVLLRFGANVKFLDELRTRLSSDGFEENLPLDKALDKEHPDWHDMVGRTVFQSDNTTAEIKMGNIFFAQLRLGNDRA